MHTSEPARRKYRSAWSPAAPPPQASPARPPPALPPHPPSGPPPPEIPLGVVAGGSLSEGLTVRLDPRFSLEKLAVGRYVVIHGRQTGRQFFGLVTDILLDATNPELSRRPPDASNGFAAEVYSGGVAFGSMHVSPMLMLDEDEEGPRPLTTNPAPFPPGL